MHRSRCGCYPLPTPLRYYPTQPNPTHDPPLRAHFRRSQESPGSFNFNMRLIVIILLPVLASTLLFGSRYLRPASSIGVISQQGLVDELRRGFRGDIELRRPNPPSIDREQLLAPFRPSEYLLTVEGILTAGFAMALSRLDTPVDPEGLRATPPRFVKPLPLSKLRKALKQDPLYFKH